MIQKKIPLTVLLLAAGAVLPATAQNYGRLDADGDGQITRSEWRGDMSEFRDRDWNRDGVLSGDEISGRRNSNSGDRNSGNRRNQNDGTRNRTGDASNGRAIDKLDENRSGVVEGFEWPYNAKIFHQLDRDHNSVLSQDELRNINTATMQDLDKNRNGRVDDEEWPGGFAQFEKLDQDRDGGVSSNEYYQRGGEYQRRGRFDQWDANRDGRLTSEEWKSSIPLFRRLDSNRDNVVDWREYQANTDRYDRPDAWR